MRIALILLGAFVGLFIGDMLGQPRGYWNGANPQQVVDWALWTGGCTSVGAIAALLYPLHTRRYLLTPLRP